MPFLLWSESWLTDCYRWGWLYCQSESASTQAYLKNRPPVTGSQRDKNQTQSTSIIKNKQWQDVKIHTLYGQKYVDMTIANICDSSSYCFHTIRGTQLYTPSLYAVALKFTFTWTKWFKPVPAWQWHYGQCDLYERCFANFEVEELESLTSSSLYILAVNWNTDSTTGLYTWHWCLPSPMLFKKKEKKEEEYDDYNA